MEESVSRTIECYIEGEDEPVWVLRDVEVPLSGDGVCIENADGSERSFTVESRTWVTSKQGEHRFGRVRLFLAEKKPPLSLEDQIKAWS